MLPTALLQTRRWVSGGLELGEEVVGVGVHLLCQAHQCGVDAVGLVALPCPFRTFHLVLVERVEAMGHRCVSLNGVLAFLLVEKEVVAFAQLGNQCTHCPTDALGSVSFAFPVPSLLLPPLHLLLVEKGEVVGQFPHIRERNGVFRLGLVERQQHPFVMEYKVSSLWTTPCSVCSRLGIVPSLLSILFLL